MSNEIDAYIQANRGRFLEELSSLLRQPSISTRNEGIAECAELLAGHMRHLGIRTEIIPTQRHPVVYGEILRQGGPTILNYGHYDVQPPEPLELWESPPFEPTIRNGKLFCRGASDNKSQLFTFLKAVETLRATRGELPVSIKFLYEGEEEIGSPNLQPFAAANREKLRADVCYCSDSHVHESGLPTIILGLKGLLYVELTARGPRIDQHSARATSVPNPAWILVKALTTLKDDRNRILIPAFYDNARPLTELERAALNRIPYHPEKLKAFYGIDHFVQGREGDHYYINYTNEPTCNIAGLVAGYTGPGSKTVLPAIAKAKIDMRLVPDQTPKEIAQKLRRHLDAQGFAEVEMTILQSEGLPSRTPIDHPAVGVIADVLRELNGEEPVIVPGDSGAGPNYIFTDTLQQPCIVVPLAYPDHNNHAPNENMDLENFFGGIRTHCRVFEGLARL